MNGASSNSVIPYTELPADILISEIELDHIMLRARQVIDEPHEVPDRQRYCKAIVMAVEEIRKYSPSQVENYHRDLQLSR